MTEQQAADFWHLLEDLHDKGTINSQDMAFVHLCLIDPSIDAAQARFEDLRETVEYLRDLMEEEYLDLQGVLEYFEEKRKWVASWLPTMMERVDRIHQAKNN